MSKITVVIKPTAGGDKLSLETEASSTVLELKEEIAKVKDMPASEQRLIYKGQILADARTLESYGTEIIPDSALCRVATSREALLVRYGPSLQALPTSMCFTWSGVVHRATHQGVCASNSA